jgi:hypothetical protein
LWLHLTASAQQLSQTPVAFYLSAGILVLSTRCCLPALLLLLLPFPVTAQVLGLTNYSHWDKAAELRSCMLKHDDIAGEQAG